MYKQLAKGLALVLVGLTLAACGSDSGAKKPIVFADAGWDSIKFHNSVAMFIAKEAYGLNSKVLTGSTPITQAALARGDADVHMEVWTDNIPSYHQDKKDGKVVEMGINFDDDKQGFYVPRYVIEGDAQRGIAPVAPDLKTVADLAKYKDVFKDEEIPEKGRVYGAIPGWEIDSIMYKKFKHYGLDKNFVYFRPGSDATLNAAFVSAYDKGLPIVGYNWEPTWISGKLDLVLLADAPYEEKAFLEGKTEARAVPVVVAVNAAFVKRAPEYVEFLKKYHTSSALTAEALAYIAENKATYDDAAVHFMRKHDNLLDKWLPADKAKAVRAALNKK